MPISTPLAVEDVTVRIGDRDIISDISFHVAEGESVALLGPNGAGKTTLMDSILGISAVERGRVTICGRAPSDALADGLVSACLQEGGLLQDLTVEKMVRYYGALAGGPAMDVTAVLERFDLARLAGSAVSVLSGGEKRRLQVALAISGNPALVMLDEPTAAMDVEARAAIWDSVLDYLNQQQRAMLFSTHLIEEAERYADRVIFLKEGRIVHDDSVAALRRDHADICIVSARMLGRATAAEIRTITGCTNITVRGRLVECRTGEPEVVRSALGADTRFSDIRIDKASLEQILFGHTDEGDH
ncbi:ATP-binding cassette domain-containing protein [Nocardia nova]|uniref:ATP-binding cassette domain-containing protein n=1 Tax=Nocardia nova TaxID=37330 RepID=UPI0009DDE443